MCDVHLRSDTILLYTTDIESNFKDLKLDMFQCHFFFFKNVI